MPAQGSAQVLSLVVFGTVATWYLVPWLKTRGLYPEQITAIAYMEAITMRWEDFGEARGMFQALRSPQGELATVPSTSPLSARTRVSPHWRCQRQVDTATEFVTFRRWRACLSQEARNGEVRCFV
jgi:hypothetical protein